MKKFLYFFEFLNTVGGLVVLNEGHDFVAIGSEIDVVDHIDEGDGHDVFLIDLHVLLAVAPELFHDLLEDPEAFLDGGAVGELF